MKILLAADIFPPQTGGPATYVVTLANELVKAGDEVVIVSHNPKSDKSRVSCRVYSVWLKNKFLRYLHYYFLLYKHARDVDVVYAMGPVSAGWPAMKVANKLGKKFVVKVVGDYAWEQGVQRSDVKDSIDVFQKSDSYNGRVKFWRAKERAVASQANLVIVPSYYLRDMVKGWGARNVKVINNSIDYVEVEAVKDNESERWIISVGRLVPWKGFDTLIEVMPEIIKKYPNVKLKIIGDGPGREYLKSKIKAQNLDGVIELLGQQTRWAVFRYLKSSDVFVLNSAYEGFSHSIIEAMLSGPVVCASNVGGNPELVVDGLNGYLFQYNNRLEIINTVFKALSISRPLAEEFREGVKSDFTIDKMIRETRQMLMELCRF